MNVEMVMALQNRLKYGLICEVWHSGRAWRDHDLSIVRAVGSKLSQLDLVLHLLESR